MRIEDYLNTEEFKTKQELLKETGITDRAIRHKISMLKKIRPVIYNSQTKGYRLARDIKSFNTAKEAREELEQIQHCINDIEARKRDMNKSERTYIAYKKKLEEEIMILENMNHICELGGKIECLIFLKD